MSCCGTSGGGGCGSTINPDCSAPGPPPIPTCCGMSGSVSIRLPNCPLCLPICPPREDNCPPPPCLCAPPPSCPGMRGCNQSSGGGCCGGSSCGGSARGGSCDGTGPCCPKPAPCTPKVLLTTKQCPRRKCCPIQNKILDECPYQPTWPAPPRIDMCCSTTCPPRKIDICYMKVCPDPPRCCPPCFACSARSTVGQCCNRK